MITDPEVEKYLKDLLPERSQVLAEVEALARRERIPIVGPVVGSLLAQLARMTGARRVFEMGSAVGYSTLWWAEACGPDAQVYFTDASIANADRARGYLERSGLADRVEILTGDALDLIEEVAGDFDIVFVDVDKPDYPRVYAKAAGRIRPGGLLVADNVLWSGRVADPAEGDTYTVALREFNRLIYSDARFLTSILPVRDGVSVSVRLTSESSTHRPSSEESRAASRSS